MTSWIVDNPATRPGAVTAIAPLPGLASRAAVKTASGGLAPEGVTGDVAAIQAQTSLRSLPGRVRSEFAGARYGNVGGMSGNVSVTSASGAITLLRREPVGSESR